MYASTGVLPKTLKLISAARLTGAQDIHRAENLAVLNCFEALREAVIHTNSAVTISMFEQCQQAVVEGDLFSSPTTHFLCHLDQKMAHCALRHKQLCNWISSSLLWRSRWNRSLGWCRSMTWILTRDTSRRNAKHWVIQRYPIRSCHPRWIFNFYYKSV